MCCFWPVSTDIFPPATCGNNTRANPEPRGLSGLLGLHLADVAERLAELERSRDEAVQKLDSQKRAATRAEREWELERQQMQVCVTRAGCQICRACSCWLCTSAQSQWP